MVVIYTHAMGWFSLADQLVAARSAGEQGRCLQRSGGAKHSSQVADRVWMYLSESLEQQRQCDIRRALGITHSSAVWALIVLRRDGKIEASPDGGRNPRYFRYRAKLPEGH